VLTAVGALVAALAGQLTPRYAAIASAVSVAAYALSRGLAKRYPPPVVVTPPTQPPA
jgi:predicted acyltransferase